MDPKGDLRQPSGGRRSLRPLRLKQVQVSGFQMSEDPGELVVAIPWEEHIVERVAWGHPCVVFRSEE